MKIAILPYEYKLRGRLADAPLSALRWPLSEPPAAGTVADLEPQDHLIIYPRSKSFFANRKHVRCRVSLLIAEPYALQWSKYLTAIIMQRRFYRIITHRPLMETKAKNVLVMPFGGAWVKPSPDGRIDKTRHMSLIASTKTKLEGHALRHKIAQWSEKNALDIDLLGLAYRKIDTKEEGLLPYRFSVVIENCREEGYFTEKLLDSLLCGTLPIYWGAPDIERYFDPEGMIICRSEEEIKNAITSASAQLFKQKHKALTGNAEKALAFADYEKNAALRLQELDV
ncbi:glycosyltransferase family 10 domain-containing protein [Hoeflea prorocentri]|uniref:Glycosyltransferase family 10 n=1 Tax=Hoeflea prorocentri TaxID=1922333 RepID=A0A9X3UJA8_9HYPH|nr:glycosyltransferase family 10 [Hoeflea prorocentri]MCY6381470.1 glycosyltransferase family 10 [Hoeflea prorocentri]MDA5399270.1 glycosyltransferase family 10 [Hoeflea prorocentri]